ncbi:MAG TPA: MarR family transcriptional regulator [Trinickia sp.]|jgi:DNA-binding MarR family transcriptional regulator|uniref:MarR family winged helix-turn-helix transcriptional regulator n=1 Tax=Trinickia sp. TaxID=2571163 RepID=UPI002F3FDFF2
MNDKRNGQRYAWRQGNIGRLLNIAVQRFERRVLQLMGEAGYDGLSLSHMAVTRNLDVRGTRATEIAKRAGITKQFVGELIGQLEDVGLLERIPDPDDGRARITRFTPAGFAWLEAFGIAVKHAEQEMKKELGAELFNAIKQALDRYGSSE